MSLPVTGTLCIDDCPKPLQGRGFGQLWSIQLQNRT